MSAGTAPEGLAADRLAAVELRDVTLRDGLQLTGRTLPVARRVDLVRALLAAGVPQVEVGSMARPDLVPPMAGSTEVLAALTPEEHARSWVWVATPRHVRRAGDVGATGFQYCLSVSDSHNRANVGRTADASMDGLGEALEAAAAVGGRVQLCLATAFSCPFEGRTDPERVLALVADARAAGTCDVVLADTIGQAVPADVAALLGAAAPLLDGRGLVFHGHDTWGLGVANALAAVAAGATTVDGALGALGGCPFAPGASGNTASEDLLFALRPGWLTPAGFHDLVGLAGGLLDELGEASRSRAARGAASPSDVFPWALPRAT